MVGTVHSGSPDPIDEKLLKILGNLESREGVQTIDLLTAILQSPCDRSDKRLMIAKLIEHPGIEPEIRRIIHDQFAQHATNETIVSQVAAANIHFDPLLDPQAFANRYPLDSTVHREVYDALVSTTQSHPASPLGLLFHLIGPDDEAKGGAAVEQFLLESPCLGYDVMRLLRDALESGKSFRDAVEFVNEALDENILPDLSVSAFKTALPNFDPDFKLIAEVKASLNSIPFHRSSDFIRAVLRSSGSDESKYRMIEHYVRSGPVQEDVRQVLMRELDAGKSIHEALRVYEQESGESVF